MTGEKFRVTNDFFFRDKTKTKTKKNGRVAKKIAPKKVKRSRGRGKKEEEKKISSRSSRPPRNLRINVEGLMKHDGGRRSQRG